MGIHYGSILKSLKFIENGSSSLESAEVGGNSLEFKEMHWRLLKMVKIYCNLLRRVGISWNIQDHFHPFKRVSNLTCSAKLVRSQDLINR